MCGARRGARQQVVRGMGQKLRQVRDKAGTQCSSGTQATVRMRTMRACYVTQARYGGRAARPRSAARGVGRVRSGIDPPCRERTREAAFCQLACRHRSPMPAGIENFATIFPTYATPPPDCFRMVTPPTATAVWCANRHVVHRAPGTEAQMLVTCPPFLRCGICLPTPGGGGGGGVVEGIMVDNGHPLVRLTGVPRLGRRKNR